MRCNTLNDKRAPRVPLSPNAPEAAAMSLGERCPAALRGVKACALDDQECSLS